MKYLVTFYVIDLVNKKNLFDILPYFSLVSEAHNEDELLPIITGYLEKHPDTYCASVMKESEEDTHLCFFEPRMIPNPHYSQEAQEKVWKLVCDKLLKEIEDK